MIQHSLTDLGWSDHFRAQCTPDELSFAARITSVARDRLFALTISGPTVLLPPSDKNTGDFAVGDWVLAAPDGKRIARRLERRSTLGRRAAGSGAGKQLIAANVDTLGIVTSCNADFNPARLERYLALAASADCLPLVILTKADLCDDPRKYARKAERLSPLVTALTLNAADPEAAEAMAPWCRKGQTLALLGSSGVGKSTLTNTLIGGSLATQDIREDDAKGRHTTTARGLFETRFGGWLIDTPGMRALRLADVAEGIDAVFEDLDTLARTCRFSDCKHQSEPGCAIQQAIRDGQVSQDRLLRWQKLLREDARNSATLHETRERDRAFGRMVKGIMKAKRQDRE